ncbi:hypothetical protein AALA22_12980 [Anaerovoracaceae bacterium 41-7]
MTNYEKNKAKVDLFSAALCEYGYDTITNTINECYKIDCDDCLFSEKNSDIYDCEDARLEWLQQEYKEPVIDWSKVQVDTLILVRNADSEDWEYRYFAKYDKKVYAFSFGTTSFTSNDKLATWEYAKLPDKEETNIK